MSYKREREEAILIAQAALKAGFRAYLAEARHYGYYTSGQRVVSFGTMMDHSLSAHWVTSNGRGNGSGYALDNDGEMRFDDTLPTFLREQLEKPLQRRFLQNPKDEARFKTPEEYRDQYQNSSAFFEVFGNPQCRECCSTNIVFSLDCTWDTAIQKFMPLGEIPNDSAYCNACGARTYRDEAFHPGDNV